MTSMPSETWPKTTCLPSNHEVLAVHKKNWLPFVLGPALAIDKIPKTVKYVKNKHNSRPSRDSINLTRSSVLQLEVLILKLVSINGLATSTIMVSKVTSLTHELRNDTVERWSPVAKAPLASAKSTEVFGRARNDISTKLIANKQSKIKKKTLPMPKSATWPAVPPF